MQQSKRRRRVSVWASALVVIALLAGGVYAYWGNGRDQSVAYRTASVVRGDVERTVTALGSLRPKEYVDVGTQVSGQLRRVHASIGERVEQGQLLAEIDPTVYEIRVRTGQANLAQLRAQLAQQEAELALAQQRLERNRRLLAQRAVSRETVEENEAGAAVARARMAAIKAQIDASESALAGDKANLGYTRIYAPMAGTVVDESAVEGQTVNASQQAPVIVRLANLDIMTVRAQVAEADVMRLAPGMPAYFTTLGMPERRWRAQVRQVLPTPEVLNDVVLYSVLMDVDNSEQQLMTDMTVQVFFLLGEARDVPVVPLAALTPRGEGVYEARVLTAQGVQTRAVDVGLVSRTSAEIRRGLEPGEKVILGRQDGAPTRPAAAGGGMRGRL
jgi:membrane fusion protein, macrolide-specific efflux system